MILLTIIILAFSAGTVLVFLLKLAGALLYWPLRLLGGALLVILLAAVILAAI